MTLAELRQLVRPDQPPFRLHLASGQTCDVWARRGFVLWAGRRPHLTIRLLDSDETICVEPEQVNRYEHR